MELLHDSDLLAIIKMLNTFGRHSNMVCAYTELFGLTPLKNKRKKWRVLLEEMRRLFDSEAFSYQRRTYQISQAGIVEALNIVVHRNFTEHLENHNYLKKIMITISEREYQERSRQGERDLRRRENAIMAGNRPNAAYPLPAEQVEPPKPAFLRERDAAPEEAEQEDGCLSREENLKRVRDLTKRVFK